MSLERRLRQMREFLRETQQGMSTRFNLGVNTWSRYERGVSPPSFGILKSLTDLGFNGHWILAGEGPMLKEDTSSPPAPQAAHNYPPFIKPAVMTRIIGVLLSNETDGRDVPLKEVAERICKYYLEDCWGYVDGTRPLPTEASTEAIESLRPRRALHKKEAS